MSQILSSLPDTQTPRSINFPERFDEDMEIWGRLLPRRTYLHGLDMVNDTYTLGRNENCDICISKANMVPNLVGIFSKVHFRISRDSTSVPYIEDLSRNGTFLNGGLIGRGRMSTLCTGDIIATGNPKVEMYGFREESSNNTEFGRKYKETRFLGRGAFGEVTLAFSKETCVRYAVKKIQKNHATFGGLTSNDEKIQNEIRILKALQHPCVIHLEEIISTEDKVYIVLEYMAGGELHQRIVKKRLLSENVAKLFFYQIALAIEYLHEEGITHRDLKPENILLASHDEMTIVKVSDFGLSKLINKESVLKSLCGTPMYVAPEILRSNGNGTYTQQVDMWSLGVVLFFCLTGDVPFHLNINSPNKLYHDIIEGHYIIPDTTIESVSTNAVDILKKSLIVDPVNRITVKQAIKHSWIMDVHMKTTFKRLLMQSLE